MKLIALLFILIPATIFSQGWEKTYGGTLWSNGRSVQQTSDGGFIITGIIDQDGSTNVWDIYLIKTDINGDTLWTKTYGGINEDRGYSVQQTIDGGYIIIGSTESYGSGYGDIYLIKTDINGNSQWTKAIGSEYDERGYYVQQTIDGGYVAVGYTRSSSNGLKDVYLVRLDDLGNILWTKVFGGDLMDYGYSVKETIDGGYIVVGGSDSFGNVVSEDVYLIKTDGNGDVVWEKTFGGSENDYGNCIIETTDGSYVISGVTASFGNGYNDVYLIKTNNLGDVIWTKTFGGELYDFGYSIQQTSDEGYIVIGETNSYGNGQYDVYLLKIKNNGDSLWTRTYGGPNDDWGFAGKQTYDDGYIITGGTHSFGPSYSNVYLIKTDEYGGITSTNEISTPNTNKELVKIIDLYGRVTDKPNECQILIEIYNDGTSRKVFKTK